MVPRRSPIAKRLPSTTTGTVRIDAEGRSERERFIAVGPGLVRPPLVRAGTPQAFTVSRPTAAGTRPLDPALMLRLSSEDAPLFPIQPAKVQRPPLADETLSRDRLLDWLATQIHRRAVLVVAEAGYGKTTLLADFSRRTRIRTSWYRLDEQDRDPVAFMNYLVAAGRQLVPGFAPTTAALLRELGTGGVSHDALVTTFVRELGGLGPEAAALIVDDYHLVDDVPEIRSIVQALLREGPERLTLVLLSRRAARLSVARLRTHGEIAELSAEDLRFRTDETERLFRDSYRRPLEPDVLDELSRRTEGWAASLQLVRTALRDRSSSEVRSFVRGLSGTQDQLYDYLAEEVVGDLEEPLRDFLMRTAILRVVEPDLASVVASVDDEGARRSIEAAERVGLLGRRGESRWSHRYHPLVQEFLVERLTRAVGPPAVVELHRTVARHAEGRDWRLGIHHWAAAGDGPDVHRILAGAIPSVMGTGEFALAESYLERFPPAERTPVFEVLLSRLDFYRNRMETALERARWAADEAEVNPVAVLNLAALEFMSGNIERSAQLVGRFRDALEAGPDSIRDIAEGMDQIIASGNEGDLDVFTGRLDRILTSQLARGETHYAGVTALNISIGLRQQGRSARALTYSSQAVDLLSENALGPELAAAYASRAWAEAHAGDMTSAEHDLASALETEHDLAKAEVLGEAADLHAWYGSVEAAADLLEQARVLSQASPVLAVSWRLAAAEIALRRGNGGSATELLRGLDDARWFGTTGQRVRIKTLSAWAALVQGDEGAMTLLRDASDHAVRQKAHLWAAICRLLAAVRGDSETVNAVLSDLIDRDTAVIHILAEEVVRRLSDLSGESLVRLTHVVSQRPRRWRGPLRRALIQPEVPARIAAARLLDEVGDITDVPRLRSMARQLKRAGADARLGKSLARRLASPVWVEDLGRTELQVGPTRIAGSSVRRKVLALLVFLLSRRGFSATRDQVLDALWPDQAPKEGLNSLNQTLYFLRRVFEPQYDEDTSPDYVHHDADLEWLDPELVESRSQRCLRLIEMANGDLIGDAPDDLANSYRAGFALDFAYEDWASAHRDRLHAAFLETMERAALARLDAGDYAAALRLGGAAITVDPTAEPLHLLVIRLCRRVGAHSAAAERYATYASFLRDELGVEPPPLEQI